MGLPYDYGLAEKVLCLANIEKSYQVAQLHELPVQIRIMEEIMDNCDSQGLSTGKPLPGRMTLPSISLVLVACICGWFMMQLEILGVRILVPYFGSSVTVVTGSVIGVFLLCLSIGYLLGGWVSSRVNTGLWLGGAMIVVGVWKFLIPMITEPVCDPISMSDIDEKWGSLLASFILFGVPTVLFGTVSPVVVYRLTARTGNAGFSTGLVLAASTLASFSGCVVTAFYLVLYSLRNTLKTSGVILMVLGAVVLTITIQQVRKQKNKLCLIVLFTAFLTSSAFAESQDYGSLVYAKNSLYTGIFVYKNNSVMTLKFGRQGSSSAQSQVDLADPRVHMAEYTEMAFCGLAYNSDPNNVLVIGLGGGVIPREMRHYLPSAEIDIVEIDQAVLPVAKQFFMFQPDEHMKVHISDGRVFVKKQKRREPVTKYDYIVLDAFTSDYIPFHLMTKEFLTELKELLADDGVIVANVWYPNQLFDAEFRTFLDVFGRCQVFCGNGNAMIVAVGAKQEILTVEQIVKKTPELQKKLNLSFDFFGIVKKLAPNAMPHPQAMILTDDRAPVNMLRNSVNR